MKNACLFALALIVAVPAFGAGYGFVEKPEPPENPALTGPARPTVPVPGQTLQSFQDDDYPYYANTPEDMIPYRGVEPFYRYWTRRLQYFGPGRDYPAPAGLKSLKVGLLSPGAYGPEGARGKRSRRGIELAFEEDNAARKPGELPIELVFSEDAPQWGSAANITVDFADNEVLGFLGTIDGDATHVALRATLKLETYMINTSDPDPTLTETQVPWLTRIWPDDRQQCFRLADLVVRKRNCHRIAVLRESSRPGRVGVMHFINYIRRLGFPPVQHLFYKAGDQHIDEQIAAIKGSDPDAVLFYGQPEDIGRFVKQFREAGIKAQFFGFDRLQEPGFQKNAGVHAEGMTITYFFNPNRPDPRWQEFIARFQKRYNEAPDIYAAYGYDGAQMMIAAIQHAGPNRYRVHDYLASLNDYDGVTGRMVFDGRWDNIVPITTANFRGGQWNYDAPPAPKAAATAPRVTRN